MPMPSLGPISEEVLRLTEDWKADHVKAISSMDRSLSKLRSLSVDDGTPPAADRTAARLSAAADDLAANVASALPSGPAQAAAAAPASDPGCESLLEAAHHHQDRPAAVKHLADAAVESWRATRVLMTHLMVQRLRRALGGDCAAVTEALVASGAREGSGLAAAGLEVEALNKQISEVKRALHDLDDLGGFDTARDSGGLAVHYRNAAGSQVHSVRIKAMLDFATEEVTSLAREFDLLRTWNKFCTESTIMADLAPADVWVYCAIWLPFPFSERDVVLHCRGQDLLEEDGCYVVTICSEEMPPEVAARLPASAAKRERVTILEGSSVRLVPLPPSRPGASQRCRATMMVHADPHIPRVPKVLVNFVLNVLAPVVYSQLLSLMDFAFRKPAPGAPSIFQRRMAARPELYEILRERCTEATDGRLTRDEDPESQRMRRDSSRNFPDATPP